MPRPSAALVTALGEIARDSVAAHQRLLAESLPTLATITTALVKCLRGGHKVLLCGNGGSAADCQHIAGELVGRFLRESEPYAALALTTDTSVLTCVGNDYSYDDVFARQVLALARKGDIVAGISTSGNSKNVLKAFAAARTRGALCLGFTGGKGGVLVAASDLCFVAPAPTTPRIQELHLLAWHSICQLVEIELLKDGPKRK